MSRRILVFTGTRAEYGLLRPLMLRLSNMKTMDLKILVSGTHLSTEYGLTYREIEKDGFLIDEKLEILISADTRTATCSSMGLALTGFGGCIQRLSPEIVVILGDRFEAFSAAAAAAVMGVPIAHLHGGELTEGAFDDGFRHAITKLSHLHFASTEDHARRIIQLGESPERVFACGALGIDNIMTLKLLTRAELADRYGSVFSGPYLLVTFHPTTIGRSREAEEAAELLAALAHFRETGLVFTSANADPGGRLINDEIKRFVSDHSQQAVLFNSLGQIPYLSAVKYCSAVIGNSSSGIIEAPSLHVPSVDIGDRQKARDRAGSVLHSDARKNSIITQIERAMTGKLPSEAFANPYGSGDAAEKISSILETCVLSDIQMKHFYDIPRID